MKIKLNSVLVDDQDKALKFNTEILGFVTARTFQGAIFKQGIPLTAFAVEDIQKEYQRMKKLGVVFTTEPTKAGPATIAVFNDTCGNLIQIYQV